MVVARKTEGEVTKGKTENTAQMKATTLDLDETLDELTELKRQAANLRLKMSKPMDNPKIKQEEHLKQMARETHHHLMPSNFVTTHCHKDHFMIGNYSFNVINAMNGAIPDEIAPTSLKLVRDKNNERPLSQN